MAPAIYDLPALLSAGKGVNLDWHPEEVAVSRLAATMTGMANANGGLVILGIAPTSAHIQGIRDRAAVLDRVFQAALLVDPPLIIPIPQVGTVQDKDVIVVQVPPGLPHVYSLDGRFLWREGTRTNLIPPRLLRQLLLERGIVQFENQVPPNAGLDDLDFEQVARYVSTLKLPGDDSPVEVLARRGCLRPVQSSSERRLDAAVHEPGGYQPTYAALLLFGRHPQQWLPNATILAARFSGKTFSERYTKLDIHGTLPDQLRQAEIFIHDHLRSKVKVEGLAHKEVPEYPYEAVRELVINAVAHRDYNQQGDTIHINIFSDRFEITSPGGLPGPVTIENLLDARYSRNAVLVQMLSDLGYIERLGYGLDRVVDLMDKNGLDKPKFEEIAGSFRVTLYNETEPGDTMTDWRRVRVMNLNPRQEKALAFLSKKQRITNSEYQEICPDVHPETLRRDLVDLVTQGVLMKIGDKRATYYILK